MNKYLDELNAKKDDNGNTVISINNKNYLIMKPLGMEGIDAFYAYSTLIFKNSQLGKADSSAIAISKENREFNDYLIGSFLKIKELGKERFVDPLDFKDDFDSYYKVILALREVVISPFLEGKDLTNIIKALTLL